MLVSSVQAVVACYVTAPPRVCTLVLFIRGAFMYVSLATVCIIISCVLMPHCLPPPLSHTCNVRVMEAQPSLCLSGPQWEENIMCCHKGGKEDQIREERERGKEEGRERRKEEGRPSLPPSFSPSLPPSLSPSLP